MVRFLPVQDAVCTALVVGRGHFVFGDGGDVCEVGAGAGGSGIGYLGFGERGVLVVVLG